MKMSLDSDIKGITAQEKALVFTKFDEGDAWRLGEILKHQAEKRNIGVAIDIKVAGRQMFYFAMPGTSPDNAEWIRRKVNTTMRLHKASYGVGRALAKRGLAMSPDRGFDPLDFVAAGGCFPIRLIGVGVVGTVTVSGVPERDDHALVVAALCQFLGLPEADYQLGQETD
jgi:uncharacterized protein (UPF0303 family)